MSFRTKSSIPDFKAVIGLLRNLAQDNENRQLLANHDLVNLLTGLIQSILTPIMTQMQSQPNQQPDMNRESALTISQSTNLMTLFAKDPNTINRIRSSQSTMNVMLEVRFFKHQLKSSRVSKYAILPNLNIK